MKDERVAAESATGRGSSVAVGPDDNLLQAVFETGFKDRVEKALVKEARRSYAEWFGIPLAKVTRRTLENSHHGLREWIKWAKWGRAQNAKDALWRAKSLQRRLEQKKVHLNQLYGCEWKMLRDLQDGSLLATVNLCVREQGRGRLRRARPASVVAEVLDGPQKRPRTDSFLHRRCF